MRARRRTQKRGGVRKRTTLDGQGLKGALERKLGLETYLKKVRARRRTQKRGRVRKHTTLDGQGLKGALEKEDDRSKAHSKESEDLKLT